MSVNPYTTNYLHWHVADTSSYESMIRCCIRVIVGVKQAFYEHGIQLILVVRVDENDRFGWCRHLPCQLVHPV